VIADNVGDNVGDVAGMGADIFDSYVASIVATMILGVSVLPGDELYMMVILPLIVSAFGIFASCIGLIFVPLIIAKKEDSPGAALNSGTFITAGAFILFELFFLPLIIPDYWLIIFGANVSGLVSGVIIGITSDYYTSIEKPPVKSIAKASTTGPATTILKGFSVGLLSMIPALIGIAFSSVIAFFIGARLTPGDIMAGGLYGVSMAAVGMLAITGMIVSSDAYGPIVDNAAGIAEQSGLGDKVVAVGDKLDAAGNTSKAITKGFAIGAAALTVLALFAAFRDIVGRNIVSYGVNNTLLNPLVLCGIFIGAMMPPLFSARLINGVESCAELLIMNVRSQFKEHPEILAGTMKPDYKTPIDIATKGALKELLKPSIVAILVTILVGIFLGVNALAGYLAGAIITGIVFALLMANSGGAWDNAKKYIEAGAYGGKGSEAHAAGVIGDTVGDPFKDTAGPSLNTLITVMSLTASLFAPLFIWLAPWSFPGLFGLWL
ncbi:MAG: sodium-translocating pyrophosphatase, partial [Promethearchaeota archaeon]